MDKDRIYNRRIELGLTQQQVADACGVSKMTVSKWESGKIETMRQDKVMALAKILNLSPLDIIGYPYDKFEPQTEYTEKYYEEPETAKIAQELFENKELRILFDAAKDVSPETLKKVHDILLVLKRSEQGDDSGC